MLFKEFLTEDFTQGTWGRPDPSNSLHKSTFVNPTEFIRHHNSLSPELHQQIKKYKSSSMEINGHLRGTPAPPSILTPSSKKEEIDFPKNIVNLDKITAHSSGQRFHVYRGLRAEFDPEDLKVGKIIHDKGFTGTSLDPHTARNFGHPKDETNPTLRKIAKIEVTRGTKGHLIDVRSDNDRYSHENEYLLHRGTHFQVTGHSMGTVYNPDLKREMLVHVVHMKVHHQD